MPRLRPCWRPHNCRGRNRAGPTSEPKELLDYLGSRKTALCVIEKERYRQFPLVMAASSVLDEEGNKLLISGRSVVITEDTIK